MIERSTINFTMSLQNNNLKTNDTVTNAMTKTMISFGTYGLSFCIQIEV